ncbi:MAG: MATE family efflux transporter [Rheinheimera sp.]|nr:MATE family efflux transporter [Rheinheimera sp.]
MVSDLYQGALLALGLSALIFIGMQFIHIPFNLMDIDGELKVKALAYLGYVAYGIFPAAGYMVLRNLFEGIGYTKAAMWISFIGILVNIPANYVFIYGKLGMPALGGPGCGLATSLVFVAMFLAILIYAAFGKRTTAYRLSLAQLQTKPCSNFAHLSPRHTNCLCHVF